MKNWKKNVTVIVIQDTTLYLYDTHAAHTQSVF
jgi:hypothetical protein